MKNLVFLITLLPLKVFCQTDTIPKNADGKYEYTDVVKVDSASPDKLYSNARLFIVDAFKSGKDVTQLNDDNAKTVVGTGTHQIIFKGIIGSAINKYLKFKIYIQCKDGRYKYAINNFELSMTGTQVNTTIALEDQELLKKRYLGKKQLSQLNEQVIATMYLLVHNIKKHMASQTDNTKDF